jgi:MoaA/NifB/PqqE/SkfB family radical SAM enzyme
MRALSNNNIQIDRVNFMITKVCNLHCRMCDVPQFNFGEKDLSLDKIKEIIREAAELGAETLELSGGEPMTRKDIYEIISYATSLKLKTFMATNGTLINPSKVERLLNAGLTMVTFSLEGPEGMNDHIRGKGNFSKTHDAIRSFLEYKTKIPELQVMVGITLSRYNYKIIHSFSQYLLEELGVYCISINPFVSSMMTPEGFKTRGYEFSIPEEMIPDLTIEMEQLAQYSESVPGKLPLPRYLRKIPVYFAGEKIIPPGGCSIPLTFCGISSPGYVFPCWHSLAIGDLRQASLRKILTSKSREKTVEQAMSGKCSGCLSSCYFENF